MQQFTFTGRWYSTHYNNIDGSMSIDLPYYTDENSFETELVLQYGDRCAYRAGQTHRFLLVGVFKPDNKGDDRYVLLTKNVEICQTFSITLYRLPNAATGNFTGYYTCVYPKDFGQMLIKCQTTCWGCLDFQPNQLAHMDPGGCLYSSDIEEPMGSDDDELPEFDLRSLPRT